jgi:hypothetical protein
MQSFSTISNNLQVLNGSGGGNTFTSDYGTAGDWTQSSTGVDVDSTAAGLVHCFEGGGADRHVKQNIGFTASDTAWVMDIDFRWTSHVTSTKGTFPYGLSDGGGQYDAGHFAGLQFTNTLGRTEKKDDAGIGTADATFIYTTLVWEYERLRRNSSTQIENRCYSDSGRTTLETNGDAALTVSSGLTGLNTITHSVNDGESVSDKFVWDCDNASIWDGLTVPP